MLNATMRAQLVYVIPGTYTSERRHGNNCALKDRKRVKHNTCSIISGVGQPV